MLAILLYAITTYINDNDINPKLLFLFSKGKIKNSDPFVKLLSVSLIKLNTKKPLTPCTR